VAELAVLAEHLVHPVPDRPTRGVRRVALRRDLLRGLCGPSATVAGHRVVVHHQRTDTNQRRPRPQVGEVPLLQELRDTLDLSDLDRHLVLQRELGYILVGVDVLGGHGDLALGAPTTPIF
jgi:hypothetical protein